MGYPWKSGWVSQCLHSLELAVEATDVSLLKLQRPSLMADWHVFPESSCWPRGTCHIGNNVSKLWSCQGEQQAKAKRKPAGRALNMQALEIISLPEVPAVTPWMEGHNCWKQLITNSMTAKDLQPSFSSLQDLSHEGKGAKRGSHAWRHGSCLRERAFLPQLVQDALGTLSLFVTKLEILMLLSKCSASGLLRCDLN